MPKYAQILKSDNTVNLIGGKEVGLPIGEHPLAYCIDITDRTEVIELYMVYDQDTDTFSFPEPTPTPVEPSTDEQLIDAYTLSLIENDLLK